jgi:arylsulfatase A-like enzyme
MHSRLAAGIITAGLAAAAWVASSAPLSVAGPKPNVLVIIADDLGYGELGCQGNPQVPTPNLDSLARQGVRFTSGYVTAPFCSPSRAGFITGRNQARFGYDINPVGKVNLNPRIGLPTNEVTIANLLQRAGYATGLIGKWHLGSTAPFHPQRRGFDEFYGFLHEGHYYAPTATAGVTSFLRTNAPALGLPSRRTNANVVWSQHMPMNEPPYDADNPILRGQVPTVETQFLTEAWAREASEFIRRHRSQPFFLELAYNAPHSPMQALDRYLKLFPDIADLHRRVFAAMMAQLDESVGQVLATMRELGLEEQTLVVFFSDNGGPTQELTSSNAPLAGGKGQLYEGGIRIPFVIQWKGHLPAGKTFDYPVSSLDLLPTVLAAAGSPPPSSLQLDGVNLLPFLTGEKTGPPHEMLFWRYGQNCAVRRGDWKLLKQAPQPGFRLFNLARDIGETNDLTQAEPQLARQLQAELQTWLTTLPKPISPAP